MRILLVALAWCAVASIVRAEDAAIPDTKRADDYMRRKMAGEETGAWDARPSFKQGQKARSTTEMLNGVGPGQVPQTGSASNTTPKNQAQDKSKDAEKAARANLELRFSGDKKANAEAMERKPSETKNGGATPRERQYILTASKTYRQPLSISEARMIAQKEDEIAAQSKDKKIPWLLGDYLKWRADCIKKQQEKQQAADKAKYAAEAPARMERQMQEMQMYIQNQELQRQMDSMRGEHWTPDGHGGFSEVGGRGRMTPDGNGGFRIEK